MLKSYLYSIKILESVSFYSCFRNLIIFNDRKNNKNNAHVTAWAKLIYGQGLQVYNSDELLPSTTLMFKLYP